MEMVGVSVSKTIRKFRRKSWCKLISSGFLLIILFFLSVKSQLLYRETWSPTRYSSSSFYLRLPELGHNNRNLQNIVLYGGVRHGKPGVPSDKLYVFENTRNPTPVTDQGKVNRKTDSLYLKNMEIGRNRRLPQAIIIGVKKGGTRALLEFLRVHPDVLATGPEPHFFDKHYHRGLEWYRSLMPETLPNQLTIEKTPSYFVTKEVPARIWKMSNSTKLLLVVRDPLTRAISDYTQIRSKHGKIKSFESSAFLHNDTSQINVSWIVLRIGLYIKHLENWLSVFSLEQIHFVHGENLVTNPGEEMSKVQKFLNLKPVITEKHFFINKSRGFPCIKKKISNKRGHCLDESKGRKHPDLPANVMASLRRFYRPFNERFYQTVVVGGVLDVTNRLKDTEFFSSTTVNKTRAARGRHGSIIKFRLKVN